MDTPSDDFLNSLFHMGINKAVGKIKMAGYEYRLLGNKNVDDPKPNRINLTVKFGVVRDVNLG